MANQAALVFVHDLATGHQYRVEVPAGNYVIICVPPCHIDHDDYQADGTLTITLKDSQPPRDTGPLDLVAHPGGQP